MGTTGKDMGETIKELEQTIEEQGKKIAKLNDLAYHDKMMGINRYGNSIQGNSTYRNSYYQLVEEMELIKQEKANLNRIIKMLINPEVAKDNYDNIFGEVRPPVGGVTN